MCRFSIALTAVLGIKSVEIMKLIPSENLQIFERPNKNMQIPNGFSADPGDVITHISGNCEVNTLKRSRN